jgi:hypothetical protein
MVHDIQICADRLCGPYWRGADDLDGTHPQYILLASGKQTMQRPAVSSQSETCA